MESLLQLKQALDAGLITQGDYDAGKHAFLRAQQIRSGFESGLLTQSDYESLKNAFLSSLGNGDLSAAPAAAPAAAPVARPGVQASVGHPVAPPAPRPAATPAPAAPPPPPSAPAQPAPTPSMPRAPSFTRQTAASSAPAASAPADSADGACVGGKSLSGISVTTQCVTLFEQLKSKGAYKFLTFKIDPSGAKVVPDQCGPANSSFSDFTDALPESDCRYAVYDCEYVNADGCQFKKLIFVLWSPDNSQIKAKMMYASTKDFLKGLFPGIAIEQQATDISEVDAEEMRLKIQATLTRK